MVLITPELVRPIPAEATRPDVRMPEEFLPGTASAAPRTPGPEVTGAVPAPPARKDIPLEELLEIEKQKAAAPALAAPAQQSGAASGTPSGGVH
jgi:hypothetical protein